MPESTNAGVNRSRRFKKRESDRSGFDYREVELVFDDGGFGTDSNAGVLVGPDEYDTPPPSNISLGGEGEISPGDTNPFYLSYTSNVISRQTQFLTTTTASQILASPEQAYLLQQAMRNWIWISGSLNVITLTSNPQVTVGKEGDTLAIQCVGSGVTLVNSNGLALTGGQPFSMTSGSIICLYYSSGTAIWRETSRVQQSIL